jgi:transposase
VKAHVKRNKNDAADAEAICEAVTRPSTRFVPVNATEQSVLMPYRARGLVVRQRTMLVDALRAHMAEFGTAGSHYNPTGRRLKLGQADLLCPF